MSTSLLYHSQGAVGYLYERTEFEGGRIVIFLRQRDQDIKCPICGARNIRRRGTVLRPLHGVPIGSKPVILKLHIQRVECMYCDGIRQSKQKICSTRRHYTKSFRRYVLDLCRVMTMQDVANHLRVGWDMVKEILKDDLHRRYCRPRLKDLRQIGIDEIAVGHGHDYFTIVLDLMTGHVVFVGTGKGGDALKPFWLLLGRRTHKIEAVAMDMSPAYFAAVTEHLPTATIVFDHFHLVKLMNEKLSELRRSIQREAEDLLALKVLKGTRWLLLKNPENLDEKRNERKRLADALRLNEPLACAYYLKEDLRQIWLQPDKKTASIVLTDWIARTRASGIGLLMKFSNRLAFYRPMILAYFDYPISTGPLEAVNNKIKTMSRQAYGFRDRDFYALKIMAIHEAKFALVG